ncbi:succinyl-CoA synthetase subunit beta [Roseibacterium elongatum DSM 19469]|uniref:Succinyl-CoA synthetase subunit beta n=1 Tax=Roseicyclus elongatus DSM 19469 TaxID=1294273 RepID=W8S5I8_9RHOB|nr:hypothetical protein [Roseibacterium elongatum]AHM04096.1 succinyl-CoA synthetase subunit beta [Roseibacterium elongatum DSM 19469]
MRILTVGRAIGAAVLVGLAGAALGSATAQTNGWGPIFDPDRFGPGQGACWTRGENAACLMLTCRGGGPFEIGLVAFGGAFGHEPLLPVFIRVDGGQTHRLYMTPLNLVEYQHAAIPYDPSRHGTLLRALRNAQSVTVALYQADSNPLPYVLGNRPAAVDRAMATCGAAPLTAPVVTPATDGARFVRVDPQLRDPQATALAAQVMAGVLAQQPETDVSASLAALPDGRRILVVEHGVSTYSYGITGVGTFVFTAAPGGALRPAYQTTGVAAWLDTAQLSEGFPDLWVQNYRGINQPYGVWRHIGGRYVHQRNVPSQ